MAAIAAAGSPTSDTSISCGGHDARVQVADHRGQAVAAQLDADDVTGRRVQLEQHRRPAAARRRDRDLGEDAPASNCPTMAETVGALIWLCRDSSAREIGPNLRTSSISRLAFRSRDSDREPRRLGHLNPRRRAGRARPAFDSPARLRAQRQCAHFSCCVRTSSATMNGTPRLTAAAWHETPLNQSFG